MMPPRGRRRARGSARGGRSAPGLGAGYPPAPPGRKTGAPGSKGAPPSSPVARMPCQGSPLLALTIATCRAATSLMSLSTCGQWHGPGMVASSSSSSMILGLPRPPPAAPPQHPPAHAPGAGAGPQGPHRGSSAGSAAPELGPEDTRLRLMRVFSPAISLSAWRFQFNCWPILESCSFTREHMAL